MPGRRPGNGRGMLSVKKKSVRNPASTPFPYDGRRKMLSAYDHESNGLPDTQVWFYTSQYTSGSVSKYSADDNIGQVYYNDQFSSGKVGSDVYARVYSDANYMGDFTDIILDIYSANKFPFDDMISSLKVLERPATGIAMFQEITGGGLTQHGRAAYMSGNYPTAAYIQSKHNISKCYAQNRVYLSTYPTY